MKKLFTLMLALLTVFALVGCTKQNEPEPVVEPEPTEDNPVMTYAEYAALPADGSATVVIEAYVQAAQSYWNGATLYLQDQDGAYFVYQGQISEEDYAKVVDSTDYSAGWKGLANGTKVHVEGTKTEWAGEVEIADAVVTLVDGAEKWKAEAEDVTALLGTDGLAEKMNRAVKFTDMVVEPSTDAEGNEVAFLYNWDGSGEEGTDSDLYFNVSTGGNTYTFVIEYYLCHEGSDAYEAVRSLNVGDTVNIEGFLYWYEGAQPHVTSVIVK
ncbi:MAG: hypothetical protein IKX97_01030 [Erysipelotrichaceae bacterium]|nr:hypothetical protein [Erysipelotrichaceae bacterium]MBR5754396.1 hypothetical protein [Erysipelotrichaceae bacterium]